MGACDVVRQIASITAKAVMSVRGAFFSPRRVTRIASNRSKAERSTQRWSG